MATFLRGRIPSYEGGRQLTSYEGGYLPTREEDGYLPTKEEEIGTAFHPQGRKKVRTAFSHVEKAGSTLSRVTGAKKESKKKTYNVVDEVRWLPPS